MHIYTRYVALPLQTEDSIEDPKAVEDPSPSPSTNLARKQVMFQALPDEWKTPPYIYLSPNSALLIFTRFRKISAGVKT